MRIIGLMSGTSADGVDAVLMEIGGTPPTLQWRMETHIQLPHPPAVRDEIFACFRPETGRVDRLCRLNFTLGRVFAQAALACIEASNYRADQVNLIGSHGQTLWHIPTGDDASTLQLGEPALIAEMTGIPVVSNFRTRDMAAGGQGAPLVAYVDQLLFTHPSKIRSLQNIGGIANVTYLPSAQPSPLTSHPSPFAFAFDTGPGNMLIDDAVWRMTNGAQGFDCNGEIAAQGQVDEELLAKWLAHPYFAQPPPRTTGRELFGVQLGEILWAEAKQQGLSDADIVATQTAFCAFSIADAYQRFLPQRPDEVIVSGGGARNTTLMQFLRSALHPATVYTSDELGLPVEAKEAAAFAILAYETWHNRPGNLPAATGARRAVVLGSITPA